MRVVVLALVIAGCGRLGFDVATHAGSDGIDAAVDGSGSIDGTSTTDAPNALVLAGLLFHCGMDADPATTNDLRCEPSGYTSPCVGSCPTTAVGHIGNALALDGANDQVTMPASLFTTGAAYSVAVWVMPTAGAGNGTVLAKPFATTSDVEVFSLIVDSVGGVLWGTTGNGTVQNYSADQSMDLRDGVWHHLAVVWTGASKLLYIDGVERGTSSSTVIGGTQPVELGVDLHMNAPLWRYTGRIDELQLYNRALSPSEVAMLAAE
jgi:hypothetical protein